MKTIRNIVLTALLLAVAIMITPPPAAAQNNYTDATGGFMKEQAIAASAARVASFTSAIIDVGAYAGGEILIDATAKTGTSPTLDFVFKSCSTTSAATCRTHSTLAQITDTGYYRLPVSGFGRYVELVGTLGGSDTPGYTYSIVGVFKPYPNTTSVPATTAQGTAAGDAGYWPVKVTNGTQSLPTGDALARSIFVKPGDGTTSIAVKAASTASAATDPALVVVGSPNGGDPCSNPSVAKASIAFNIPTATTTSLVAVSASTQVYVCGFAATLGASTTVSLESGTSTACTGTRALTGVFTPATGGYVHIAFPLGPAQAADGVCAVTTGTGGANGVLSYVQR
jgi:hypothetical protein